MTQFLKVSILSVCQLLGDVALNEKHVQQKRKDGTWKGNAQFQPDRQIERKLGTKSPHNMAQRRQEQRRTVEKYASA